MLSFIADWATFVSLFVGLLGFLIVLYQLSQTKKSADAARKSAQETLERVAKIVAVVSIGEICSRSRDVLHLTQACTYCEKEKVKHVLREASTAGFELREAVAKFAYSKAGLALQKQEIWLQAEKEVREIHDALVRGAEIGKINATVIIAKISRIHSQFSSLASVAGEIAGENNANS